MPRLYLFDECHKSPIDILKRDFDDFMIPKYVLFSLNY